MKRGLPLGLLTVVVLLVVAAGVVIARTGPRRPAVAPPAATRTTLTSAPFGADGQARPATSGAPSGEATAIPSEPGDRTAEPVAVPTLGPPTKTSGCLYRTATNGALLPDTACTPGTANPQLTADVLCAPGFTTRQYRHVTEAQKRRAYMRYGVASHATGEYEVDHLLAIEDGGANDDANLWPQPASPAPGFHQKDVVETYVHRQVCAGAVELAEAQRQIASDWTSLLDVAAHAGLAPKQHSDDGDESD